MYCKKCGKEIPEDAIVCPYCATPTNDTSEKRSDRNKGGKIIGIIAAVLCVMIIIITAISGNLLKPIEPQNNSQQQSQSESSSKTSKPFYEDKYIKASFIKIEDAPYLEDTVYLYLSIENKSNKTIVIGLTESAVNGMSTMIMGSGVATPIAPGNSSQQPFTIFTANVNAKKAKDINKIQFKISVMDNDTYRIIDTSKTIIFTF